MASSFIIFAHLLMLLLNSNITIFCTTQTIFNSTTDQNALLAFKNSITSNPNSTLATNWSSSASVCSWIGVACGVKHTRVTALNISNFNLGGNLAPHLGNLTFLQSLDVSFNNFTGFIPSDLSNLRRLKKINAGFNKFTGEIPPWFGALSELRYLQLNNNTFSGEIPQSLFKIPKLRTLDVRYNFLHGNIPAEIGNVSSSLETLKLAGNGFSGAIPIVVFTNMSSLIEIDLRFNRISGKLPNDMCSNTPNLKRIYLSVNEMEGEIPANICKCRVVEDIRLPFNRFSGRIPTQIGCLTMLAFLSLFSNNFTGGIPEQIGNLTSLTYLHLATNNLIGQIPKQVGNLTSLTDLYLYENNFAGEIPEELRNLKYLQGFSVRSNSLYGQIPSFIFNASTIKLLTLSFNQFSGTLPPNMGVSLLNLQRLYLSHNTLSGPIPSSIANISQLISLEMNANSFSGSIPSFANLRLLQFLRLWDNNLTATQELGFLSSLTNCIYLEALDVSYNPLNAMLPASIGNLSASLTSFRAEECSIKGAVPREVGNMSSLLELSLSGNELTGSLPTEMKHLKQLQRLNLGTNQLQGRIPLDLCQMSNLGELNLGRNLLVGEIPECLGELQDLKIVYLNSNKLNSTIPSNFWSNLRDLVQLNLSSNSLSGHLSSQIGNLKAVNTLDLSSNQFSGDIPNSIDECQLLGFLSLSYNMFSGSIPQSLGGIGGLDILDLSNNNLSGVIPQALENLRFLSYLDVSYNRLEGQIPNGGPFVNVTAEAFAHNQNLCGMARFQVPPCPKNKKRAVMLLKYILPSLISALILVIIVLVLIRRRVMGNTLSPPENLLGISWRRISYLELVRATGNFSEANLLGKGSFGSVFKGTLSDGLNIAVKVFHLELERAIKSFETECQILSSIRHRNSVRIVGSCSNTEFRAIILVYMPNGSLEKWLYSDNCCLDLLQRLQVAIDVALALEYLHHGHTFSVVHCDIKPSNVLLDEDMIAHVGDFGIAKLFDDGEVMVQTQTIATIGYAAPEYGSEGKVSTNGDVYSYGILLVEMFTSKRPTDDMFEGEIGLKEWVSGALQENKIIEVVASGLVSRDDQDYSKKEQCVSSIFELAMECLAFAAEERMNMIQVVVALHKIKAKVVTTQVINNINIHGTN